MDRRFKELIGVVERLFIVLASVLGGVQIAPPVAKAKELQSTVEAQQTVQPENVSARIDAIRKAFDKHRRQSTENDTQSLKMLAQEQPFYEFDNFVSFIDFHEFLDFHNFGEWNNN